MVILKQHNQEYTISTTRYFSLRSTHTLPLNYSVTLCCTYINTHSHTFPPTLSTVSHHGSTALTLQYTWCEGSSGTSDCQSCQPKAHQGKVEHSGSGPPSHTLVHTRTHAAQHITSPASGAAEHQQVITAQASQTLQHYYNVSTDTGLRPGLCDVRFMDWDEKFNGGGKKNNNNKHCSFLWLLFKQGHEGFHF